MRNPILRSVRVFPQKVHCHLILCPSTLTNVAQQSADAYPQMVVAAVAVALAVAAALTMRNQNSASKSNDLLMTLATSPHGQSKVLQCHLLSLALAFSYPVSKLDERPRTPMIPSTTNMTLEVRYSDLIGLCPQRSCLPIIRCFLSFDPFLFSVLRQQVYLRLHCIARRCGTAEFLRA